MNARVEAAAMELLRAEDAGGTSLADRAAAALAAADAVTVARIEAEIADAPHANYEEDNYEAGYLHGLAFALAALGDEP